MHIAYCLHECALCQDRNLTLVSLIGYYRIEVCKKPIDLPNPTQSNPTRRVGSVFKAWWVGLGYKNFFYNGLGWVWVIKLQTRQTRLDPPTHPYLIYIIYLIIFFKTSCRAPTYIYIYIIFNHLKKKKLVVEQHFLDSSY